MKQEHTEGPWTVGDLEKGDQHVLIWASNDESAKTGYPLAQLDRTAFGIEEQIANAQLIAAAPDMLEALELSLDQLAALEGFFEGGGEMEAITKAKAAISKATGEQL